MCDTLVALAPATANGVTLFAKNSDRPPAEPQDLEWLSPRLDREAVWTTHIAVAPHPHHTLGALVSRPRWSWGVEHGVNEAGVAIGNEAIYTTADPRAAPAALTGLDLVRLALERAASAAEGVEVITGLLERYGQGGTCHQHRPEPYWSSFLVADPHDAWVVETSGRQWAAEHVDDVRAISNRTTIATFDAEHRHPRQPVEVRVDPRLAASRAVLATRPVSVGSLQAHLRSHAQPGGWSVCMHTAEMATTASMVAELPDRGPPRAWCLLGSPCRSVYVPVTVGMPLGPVPPWEELAALPAVRSPRLDELEAWLRTERPGAPPAWAQVAQVVRALPAS
jgi:secernin